jgi:hypothetical protein
MTKKQMRETLKWYRECRKELVRLAKKDVPHNTFLQTRLMEVVKEVDVFMGSINHQLLVS